MNKGRAFFWLFYLGNSLIVFAQEKPELVVTTGHHEVINSISFSKNGRYVASGGGDKILKIYDLNMQQEFNSLVGHSADIRLVKFSANNKYIFTFSGGHIYTWSHPKGELLHKSNAEEKYTGETDECYVSSNNKIYIAQGSDGLVVFDPVANKIEKTWENIKIENVVHLAKQNLFVGREQDTVDSDKYNLNFYDGVTGVLKKSVPIEGLNTGGKFLTDSDEELIALETTSGKATIVNTKTFAIISKIQIAPSMLTALEFYHDKKRIIATSWDNKVRICDIASGKIIQEFGAEILNGKLPNAKYNMAIGICDIKFSPNGKTIGIAYNFITDYASAYRIAYYSSNDLTLKHKYDGQNKTCVSLITDNEETKLVVGNLSNPSGSRIWNLKKGEIETYHRGMAQVKVGNNKLVMFNYAEDISQNFVRLYEFSTMKLLLEIHTDGAISPLISPNGNYIAGYVTGVLKTGMPETNLLIWDANTGKEILKRKTEIQNIPKRIMFKPNNQLLLIETNKASCIDASTGKTVSTFNLSEENPFLYYEEFDKTGNELYYGINVDEGFEIKAMNTETGQFSSVYTEKIVALPFMMKFSPDYSKLAVSIIEYGSAKPYKVLLYDWNSKTILKTFDDFTAPVFQINFGLKTGNMYLGDNNGVVTIIGSDYLKKASLLASNQRDYMIISPEYYYKTSITNTEGIAFRYKDDLFRFDQFDLRYNRPDMVMEKMGIISETQITMYKDAWLKRLKRLGFDEQSVATASIHAPSLTILGKDDLPFNTSAASIKFNIKCADSLSNLKRIAVYVNNIPLFGKNGFAITASGTHKFDKEIEIALEEGKNKIAVSVFNEVGVESIRESFVTECSQKFAKPDLYILAIGVSKYKDTTMNLTYSDKDVKDVVEIFNKNNSVNSRYANIYTKVITNEEATIAKIDAAAVFLKNSKVNDQVVLFYSGHGLIDQKMDYYLAMNDIDFIDPAKAGLLYTHFQDFFDGLACRKRLLLIDACHSGEFDKNDYSTAALTVKTEDEKTTQKEFKMRGKKVIGIANTNDLMKELFTDLRKETGATVIASSSGTEFSVESSQWKNGAFTFALKEGLADMKADGNKNKEITLSETRDYVIKKVKELTAGRQNPTTRQENIDFDFRLW